jgi:hypothetical protein
MPFGESDTAKHKRGDDSAKGAEDDGERRAVWRVTRDDSITREVVVAAISIHDVCLTG